MWHFFFLVFLLHEVSGGCKGYIFYHPFFYFSRDETLFFKLSFHLSSGSTAVGVSHGVERLGYPLSMGPCSWPEPRPDRHQDEMATAEKGFLRMTAADRLNRPAAAPAGSSSRDFQ